MRKQDSGFTATVILSTLLFLSACLAAAPATGIRITDVRLPPGFSIEVFTDKAPGARSMAPGPDGVVFVGTRKDTVYAVMDRDRDGLAETVRVLARNLDSPNGVAFRDGALYVAEVSRILKFDDILSRLDDPGAPVVVYDGLPDERHHGWKYIAFGPDGLLYIPVGAPCNICERADERFSAILRMNVAGGEPEVFAHGIRNTVGFDWNPADDTLWFTNNGRDWMGDDQPPDTLHHAPQKGMHFGFPYCHGGDIKDPEFGQKRPCSDFTPPDLNLPAHVAPLGMAFYTGKMFPVEYRGCIFIAEHGSWNRSTPIGYRITKVCLKNGRPAGYVVFADGWLKGNRAWGRPVDVIVMPDGALLVSDDRAGAIYRITYGR